MRKLYALSIILSMMILSSTGAKAKVSSMADLFGKYKFTATVEVTGAGKAYEANILKEGEVIITKDAANIYDAQITGFAVNNATEAMKVNSINTETCKFQVKNPSGNSYGAMGGLYYSDINGTYPFGETQIESLVFVYDPETKAMTCNDFSLVGNCDYSASTCEIIAKFTNVKLTLLESEKIDIADITGEWKVTAGSGTYDTKEGSPLPTSYTLALAQYGDANTYKATFTVEGIAPFTLDATFDGNKLEIPYDGNLVDEAKGYRLVSMYSGVSGNISFNYTSESSMTMGNSLVIGTISQKEVEGEKKDVIDYVQWWMNGSAKKQSDAPAFSWAGTYNSKSANYMDLTDGADVLPTEGETVITYYEAIDTYYITKLFGFDVGSMNNGGMKLTLSADNPKEAEVSLNSSPYGAIYIKSSDDMMTWYKLIDVNGYATSLKLTANDDGTLTLGDFFVAKGEYGSENTYVCGYQTNTLTPAKEEPVVLTWDGTYEATASVTKYAEGDYPSSFPIVIAPEGDYGQFVTTFITEDANAANYGGIRFTPSKDDANKAEMLTDKIVKTVEAGKTYWKIFDMNGSTSPLSFTRNEDGSVSIGSFSLFEITYDESWNEQKKCLALYNNITAQKSTSGIDNVSVSAGNDNDIRYFDLSGRALKSAGNGRLVIVKTAKGVKKVLVK
ncbi:MAG: hypothetical protein PUF55_07185 [Bacteroidales bacterium]|nr:hypothetical protein [Bacteroidales bacterium]